MANFEQVGNDIRVSTSKELIVRDKFDATEFCCFDRAQHHVDPQRLSIALVEGQHQNPKKALLPLSKK